mgnify:CR=1 FL=1
MRWKIVGLISVALLGVEALAQNRVRTVEVVGDQIVPVRTAVGIATIIQVPDTPSSVVLGDLSAFKVEYLDSAITVKPLKASAASNLYIHTDWKRYTLSLSTGPKNSADYIVYLKPKEMAKPKESGGITWQPYQRMVQSQNLKIDIVRVGHSADGFGFIEFKLAALQSQKIDPGIFWLTQSGKTKSVHGLYLAKAILTSGTSTTGLITMRLSEFERAPVILEIREKKTVRIAVSKEVLWAK